MPMEDVVTKLSYTTNMIRKNVNSWAASYNEEANYGHWRKVIDGWAAKQDGTLWETLKLYQTIVAP